jgi:hypothetical protein
VVYFHITQEINESDGDSGSEIDLGSEESGNCDDDWLKMVFRQHPHQWNLSAEAVAQDKFKHLKNTLQAIGSKPAVPFESQERSFLKSDLPLSFWLELPMTKDKVCIKAGVPAAARLCVKYYGKIPQGCTREKCAYGHNLFRLNRIQYALIQSPKTWCKLLRVHMWRERQDGMPATTCRKRWRAA